MSSEELNYYAIPIGILLTITGLFFSGFQLRNLVNQRALERSLNSLNYVSDQFDRLSSKGAREIMSLLGDNDALKYINNLPSGTEDEKEEANRQKHLLMEYVYTFNRIGVGVYKGFIDRDVLYNIWPPYMFENHRRNLKSLIADKRKTDDKPNSYVFFDWLVTTDCTECRDKYPEKRGINH